MEDAKWRQLYEDAGSVLELSRRLGLARTTVRYHLVRAGVPIKRSGFAAPRRKPTRAGPEHHNWKGGLARHTSGYVMEYAPDHPAARANKGYVMQHRLVMERALGRYLLPDELVHHLNEDKADNRPENLQLMNRRAHVRHHKEHAGRASGRFT